MVLKTAKDTEFAAERVKKIRAFAYLKRHDFHYHGNVAEPEDVIQYRDLEQFKLSGLHIEIMMLFLLKKDILQMIIISMENIVLCL